MTPADINPWLSLFLSAIAVGGFLWNHLTSGGAKALKEVADLKRKLEEDDKVRAEAIIARFQLVENRVTAIEGELKHLPDGDAAHRLEMAVEKLNGKLEILEERMKPIAAINQRLQEWVLEARK